MVLKRVTPPGGETRTWPSFVERRRRERRHGQLMPARSLCLDLRCGLRDGFGARDSLHMCEVDLRLLAGLHPRAAL